MNPGNGDFRIEREAIFTKSRSQMKSLQRLGNLLFKSKGKPIDKVIEENMAHETIDKVSNFNKLAPGLFGPGLKEFGYELCKIENSEHNGFLWSTHHFYENGILKLKHRNRS